MVTANLVNRWISEQFKHRVKLIVLDDPEFPGMKIFINGKHMVTYSETKPNQIGDGLKLAIRNACELYDKENALCSPR